MENIEIDKIEGDVKLLTDGKYHGLHGGYESVFHINGEIVKVHTKFGVKGLDYPSVLTIKSGKLRLDLTTKP